ncbi:MAG: nucleotidyl transferase AbiEii/AbiGii toxin family protein [Coriobacteriia bacterium]|nr:nucleotidyl transferase AbiEii/AbiGii toxin family protein [Coriobacteriia bacterium]
MRDYLDQLVAAAGQRDATNVMREYLQARILEALQERGAWGSLAFMGGTALRFLYRIPRFSEDLDFCLEGSADGYDFARLVSATCSVFEHEGYAIDSKVSTHGAVNKAYVRFPGLERSLGLSPHADQAFSVKLEVDTNPPAGAGVAVTTVRRFATLRIAHHDKASLLAGKTAAILLRDWVKGRDIYDLVWYLSDPTWPEPNEELLLNACRQAMRPDLWEDRNAWKGALHARLEEAAWDHVLQDAQRFLERPQDAWMLERETVLSVLQQRGWVD